MWHDFWAWCVIVTVDAVPAARLKVLPFMELWTGENQLNTEPIRGSCLITPYSKQRQRKSRTFERTGFLYSPVNMTRIMHTHTSSMSFSSLAFCSSTSASRMPFRTTSVMFSKSCSEKQSQQFRQAASEQIYSMQVPYMFQAYSGEYFLCKFIIDNYGLLYIK